MKIIEALKQLKDLQRKAQDLVDKIAKYSADMEIETAMYPDQKQKIAEWLQSHRDTVHQILTLRYRIQKTNIATKVTMIIGENELTKSIAEWIHRRKDLAALEKKSWDALTDRNLRDQRIQQTAGGFQDIKVRRYYDPVTKDKWVSYLASEPSLIDGKLEIVNATTDLLD
jgi:hypothetical protein